ncbi:MAG: hypothetical protein EXQ70_07330 [Solirubrobacterales bacterium]|nr:hypothetical protein [Solirubrobacterales bacterium]
MARIVALVPDLMFGSRVQQTLIAAGHDVELRASADDEALTAADLIVADLAENDVAGLTGRGVPVLGFYSHVDVETKRRAEDAGVDLAVPRSRMAREMPALVERLLAST